MSMTACSVYWIHHPEHTDMFTQGYIGVSNNVHSRWLDHKRGATNAHFKSAIQKYGWDTLIKKEILIAEEEYCLEIEKKLRSAENTGWNITIGGGKPPVLYGNKYPCGLIPWNKGVPMRPESKEKLSQALKGMRHDPEVYKQQALKRTGEKNVWFGKKFSDEYKLKLSLAKKGKPSPRKGIPLTPEAIKNLKAALKGRIISSEHRQKLSVAALGIKQPLVTCPHCEKIGGARTMKRWHFDRCKHKENQIV